MIIKFRDGPPGQSASLAGAESHRVEPLLGLRTVSAVGDDWVRVIVSDVLCQVKLPPECLFTHTAAKHRSKMSPKMHLHIPQDVGLVGALGTLNHLIPRSL